MREPLYQVTRERITVTKDPRSAYVPGHFCSSHKIRKDSLAAAERCARDEPGVWFAVEKTSEKANEHSNCRKVICRVKAEVSIEWDDCDI